MNVNCDNCEMNMTDGKKCICAVHNISLKKAIKKYPNGCFDWEIAFCIYQELSDEELEELLEICRNNKKQGR